MDYIQQQLQEIDNRIEELQALLEDPELKDLALQEIEELKKHKEEFQSSVVSPPTSGWYRSSDSLKADSERSERSDSCRLILQIHDELLFECDPKTVKEIAKMVKEKMENALKLSVPVVVDLKIGPNWGEMEKLKI